MRASSNILACALLGLLAVGCKGDSSESKPAKAAKPAKAEPVAATVTVTVDGKPSSKASLGALFDVPPALVTPSKSVPLLDALYNLGVSRFKAVVAVDDSGHELRIGESILLDSNAKVTLAIRASGPTITVENAPSTIDAKDFGILASLDLSNVTFRMPDIDPDSAGSELAVIFEGKTTPFSTSVIADKSSFKLQRNDREVSVLPLAEIGPADVVGEVTLKGSSGERTLPWPSAEPIYLYVNRRGNVHALIGETHARHASGSGRTENKAAAPEGDDASAATTIREIATIDFVRKGADTPVP